MILALRTQKHTVLHNENWKKPRGADILLQWWKKAESCKIFFYILHTSKYKHFISIK